MSNSEQIQHDLDDTNINYYTDLYRTLKASIWYLNHGLEFDEEHYQKIPYLTYILFWGMSIILISYAIIANENIFVNTFSINFLDQNGAFYLPRNFPVFYESIFTYIFLHINFFHFLNNMIVFLLFARYLERKFYTPFFFLMFILGAIGSFFGTAFYYVRQVESRIGHYPIYDDLNTYGYHSVVGGFSGVLYSYMGLYLVNLVLNWSTHKTPSIIIIYSIAFLIEFFLNFTDIITTKEYTKVIHIAGMISGIISSLYLLKKNNKIIEVIALLGMIFIFGICPTYSFIAVYQ